MAAIPKKSVSIGYNPINGQAFFDTLMAYDDYIRDYFFGLRHGITGGILDAPDERKLLKSCDTYDYNANLLFNNYYELSTILSDIDSVKDDINLKHVTILDPSMADVIREHIPDVEIQLSVRFWDWGRFENPIARLPELKSMGIDVINVSGACSYNDFEFMNRIHELGMLVKFITAEGCILRKDINYRNLPGFKDTMCRPNPFSTIACCSECIEVEKEYPWMTLATNTIYKESLKYYPQIDIFKISGRHRYLPYLTKELDYWISDNKTVWLKTNGVQINAQRHYDVFLDFVEYKATKCRSDCAKCQKCKYFWNELTN